LTKLSTNQLIEQRLHYIHNIPVEAGFVSSPKDYLYSSARDYEGGEPLEVLKLKGMEWR